MARERLILAYRLYGWLLSAACLAVALFLAVMALGRPLEISESTPLLLSLAAGAVLTAVVRLAAPRAGAVVTVVGAVALVLWLLAQDPSDTAPLTGMLAAVAAVDLAALAWLRPWLRDPLAPGNRRA